MSAATRYSFITMAWGAILNISIYCERCGTLQNVGLTEITLVGYTTLLYYHKTCLTIAVIAT